MPARVEAFQHPAVCARGRLDAFVAETVAAGGRIGTVGSEGGKPAALVFEIRKNENALDAATWLGL